MVARGRADIALVTRSYLSDFMVRDAQMARAVPRFRNALTRCITTMRCCGRKRNYGAGVCQLLKRLRDSGQC